jgi:hypothetical protein
VRCGQNDFALAIKKPYNFSVGLIFKNKFAPSLAQIYF